MRELNRVYRATPALWQRDTDPGGFRWVLCDAADDNVLAFLRFAADGGPLLAVSNFSPVVRLRLPPVGSRGVPVWREELNTDDVRFGGSGVGAGGPVKAEDGCVSLTLPPLATVWLVPES